MPKQQQVGFSESTTVRASLIYRINGGHQISEQKEVVLKDDEIVFPEPVGSEREAIKKIVGKFSFQGIGQICSVFFEGRITGNVVQCNTPLSTLIYK